MCQDDNETPVFTYQKKKKVDRRGTCRHSAGGTQLHPACWKPVCNDVSKSLKYVYSLAQRFPPQRFSPKMLLEECIDGWGVFTAAENWEHPKCPTTCNTLQEGWSTCVLE